MSRLSQFPTYRLALLTLFFLAASSSICRATKDNFVADRLQWWHVPQPVLETGHGFNLYWHDPTLGWREHCRYFPPSTLGCAPLWYAQAEAVFLNRDSIDRIPFATLGAGGDIVLSSSDFDAEFETAGRFTLGVSLGDWYRLEVGYFGAPTWESFAFERNLDTNALGGLGNLFTPFSNFGVPAELVGYDYADFVSVQFSSKLQGGELNLRKRLLMRPGRYESSVLLGARMLDIDETFGFRSTSPTPGPAASQNLLDVNTQNELIGVQIGVTGQYLVRPRLWIDADIRGGIYNNNASQSTQYQFRDEFGAVTNYALAASNNRTSFAGELKVQLNCHFTRSLTGFGGYNAMIVSGVALADENFETDPNILTLGPAKLDHGGNVVYHGPHFGLVYSR